MAITVATCPDGAGQMPGTRIRHADFRRGKTTRSSQRRGDGLVAASADRAKWPSTEVIRASDPASLPGVIGGAVIQAARRSAHLTRPSLARLLNIGTATVHAWENGTIPLFSLPYGHLLQLATDLKGAGAHVGHELSELLLASQCDLMITGMLHGFEDYAEVPPIEERSAAAEIAQELLRWALANQIPDRYRQFASARPLLIREDIDLFAAIARGLQAGSRGQSLVGYGSALICLADH